MESKLATYPKIPFPNLLILTTFFSVLTWTTKNAKSWNANVPAIAPPPPNAVNASWSVSKSWRLKFNRNDNGMPNFSRPSNTPNKSYNNLDRTSRNTGNKAVR